MKQKTRFKKFGNIGYQYRLLAPEWSIYLCRPLIHNGCWSLNTIWLCLCSI